MVLLDIGSIEYMTHDLLVMNDKEKNCKIKNIVLVGGCFDILHFGHISFLQQAKKYGNYLMVLLESDEHVQQLKGAGRPIHTQQQRKYMLESLSCVDEVFLLPSMHADEQYSKLIAKIKPTSIACSEGDPMIQKKKMQADMVGANIIVIPHVKSPSTSNLVKLLRLE